MTWIKVSYDLPDKIEVIQIATKLGIDQDEVVGKLIRVWGWFERYADGGHIRGLSGSHVDRLVSMPGFGDALESVGWLNSSGGWLGVISPDLLCGTTRRRMSVQETVDDFARQLEANSRRCGQVISKEQWAAVLEHFRFSCAFCGSSGVPLTVEHLTPVSRGGGNEVGNLVPACEPCNYSKNDRFPLEWFFARRVN